jgi:short-subunit dehydrogenase
MGYHLTLLGRSKDPLEATSKSLSAVPNYLIADLSLREGRESAAAEILAISDGFDLIIPNAGVAYPAPLAVSKPDRQEETIAVNLLGNMQIIQAALPAMLRKRRGDIIGVVSTGDSWTARILGFFPRLLAKIQPMLMASGEKGRKKYLENLCTRSNSAN